MTIYTSAQIREWEAFSCDRQGIPSIVLMERAASACRDWIQGQGGLKGKSYSIFCGKGNNGGDGVALARLLIDEGHPVTVYILEFGHKGTGDFQANLAQLHGMTTDIYFIQGPEAFPSLSADTVIVDALLGSGLNRPLEGLTETLVRYLNDSGLPIVALDLPSGMRADGSSKGSRMVRARHTLMVGAWKVGLLLPENAPYFGEVHFLPIGLEPGFEAPSPFRLTDEASVRELYRPRPVFSHKGNFGHALLIAGSQDKMGACILSVRACLRSGVGLLTCLVDASAQPVLQTSAPEAMSLRIGEPVDLSVYQAAGIGPGIGTNQRATELLAWLLASTTFPLVLDADALNLLDPSRIPAGSVLTPHPKEFERLFGPSPNDFERVGLALAQAREHQCVIVLKGHRTFVAHPDGTGYFNTTGNPGMATGGSGDVLTGIVTGLLAQGYPAGDAAILGVFLHGRAGDLALSMQSVESLTAGDIPESLGAAFKSITSPGNTVI